LENGMALHGSKSGEVKRRAGSAALAFLLLTGIPMMASAQVKVGVTVSATGPQASLGIPEMKTVEMLPRSIGGQKIEYVVLDDASDPTRAVTNVRKLVEEKVDLVVGSSTTPNTLAFIDVAAEAKTPVISLASSARLILPMDANKAWIFKAPHSDSHMASSITEHMSRDGLKSVAFLGFNNALGEAFWAEISRYSEQHGIKVLANERFSPTDVSVTAQVLKIMSTNPDAVVVGASGTPAAMPAKALVERGYKGRVYFNHGVSNNDFLKLCGNDCEGMYVPTGPIMVAAQLPASHPAKAQAAKFRELYEAKFGPGTVSLFAAYTWDIGLLLNTAVPAALKKAAPGTEAFRAALREALENVHDLHTATGVVNMSPADHVGLDQRSRVMVRIQEGTWKLAP
jgi:branched-chain amino acid transport system substrate-binding protein